MPMPFVYDISSPERHVRVVGRGAVTTEQCIEAVYRIISDPKCLPDYTALVDVRELDYVTKDDGEIIQVAQAIEALKNHCRNNIAIVARGYLLFTAELLAAHVRNAEHINMRVFWDAASAEEFCGQGLRRPARDTCT